MKKVILLAAGAIALGSVTAYAQTNHRHAPAQSDHGMMQGPMHGQMHAQMHDKMHGKMKGMPPSQQHGGDAGHGAHGPQSGDAGHAAHGAQGAADGPRGDRGPSSAAFHAINEKMHQGMSIAFTGNTDVDFVNGMIPHHQGAVDMAKVVLAFGKDPEIRKLAEAIIQAQESEIAMMRAWLKRNAQ
jgi:uncharacterized protein (DUF305 family)